MKPWANIIVSFNTGISINSQSEYLQLARLALGWVASIKTQLKDIRWHYKWTPDQIIGPHATHFLRVELDCNEPLIESIANSLNSQAGNLARFQREEWLKNGVFDRCWQVSDTDSFASVWWQWSELITQLVLSNPNLTWQSIQELHCRVFHFFTSGDQCDLIQALKVKGLTNPQPSIDALVKVMSVDSYPISYVLPPRSRLEAVDTARIHYLMNSIWASDSYPWMSNGLC